MWVLVHGAPNPARARIVGQEYQPLAVLCRNAKAIHARARAGGGYSVEVTGPHGHHLVPVQVGVFDDAAGKVQVTGAGLAAGQRVVVPAL